MSTASNMPGASARTAVEARGAEIEQLLARGKARRALDLAKDLHKSCGNPESEALLVRAYRARVEEMLRQGMTQDAQALLTLVSERYPANFSACADVQERLALRSGKGLDGLARLSAADLTDAERERLEGFVRRSVADPRQVADFAALPATHPLRLEAEAIVRALSAVTSRAVTEAELALPEVSRQSPFAAWKLFVRAVARFYQRQDEECRKCLAALAADAVPARLAPLLHGLLDGKVPRATAGQMALAAAIAGDTPRLRQTLADLDTAFRSGRTKAVLAAIATAVQECRRQRPELLDRLRQHIAASAMAVGVSAEPVRRALGANSIKDAYFWRLFARVNEKQAENQDIAALFSACAAWEEFRRHAVHQGWFAPGGPEEAAVYLHLIDIIATLSWEEFAEEREDFVDSFCRLGGMATYYRAETGQPAAVMACAPPAPPETYFLYPELLFERACQATPTPELFQRWLDWTQNHGLGPHTADEVATAWHATCPADPRPLLVLAENAEARDALGKALKFLKAAEALDGMNIEVRRARPRLVLATALRHLRKQQQHLVGKDLAELAALPQMGEGDRPVLTEAVRWVAEAMAARPAHVDWAMPGLVAAAGDRQTAIYAAHLIAFESEAHALVSALLARLQRPDLESVAFLRAAARVRTLWAEMHLSFSMPNAWVAALPAAVRHADANLTEAQLRSLAAFLVGCCSASTGAASSVAMAPLAYHLAGLGLRRPDADHAQFLLLRGQSLLIEDARAPERGLECLRAARVLAARRRDMALVEAAWDTERRYRYLVRAPFDSRDNASDHLNLLSSEEIQRVLTAERDGQAFPLPQPQPRAAAARPRAGLPRSAAADRRQGFLPGLGFPEPAAGDLAEVDDDEAAAWADDLPLSFVDDDESDDELDDEGDDDLQGLDDGLPPGMVKIMEKLVAKYGDKALQMLVTPDALARKEPQLFQELLRIVGENGPGPGAGGFLPPEPRRGRRK